MIDNIILGFLIILVNIGSRYVILDIPKNVEHILSNSIVKLLIVFSIIFVSTRDFQVSLLITLIFTILTKFLLHEDSSFCVIPKYTIDVDVNKDKKITFEEIARAQKILDTYKSAL